MKRIGIIIGLILVLLITISVQAATWAFQFPIIITDTSNISRTYYPVVLPNGTSTLSTYITGNGLNTNMQEGTSSRLYMLSTGKITTIVPSLPAGGRAVYSLYTGYSPVQTGFPIITGDGGYITTNDTAALELGSIWYMPISAYIDTTTSGTVASKTGAWSITKGSGNVTASILNASANVSPISGSGVGWVTVANAYDGNIGTTASVAINAGTDSTNLTLGITPNNIINVNIYPTRSVPTPTISTMNVYAFYNSTWNNIYSATPTYGSWNYITLSAPQYINSLIIGFHCENDGGLAGTAYVNEVQVGVAPVVTVTSASGDVLITPKSDGANFWLTAGSAVSANTTTATVLDNSNPIIWSSNITYFNYIQIWINGIVKLAYQPEITITGNNLPDRAHFMDGDITWGTNQNISLTYGAIVSSNSTSISSGGAATPSVLPDFPMPSRWFGAYQLTAAQADLTFTSAFFYDAIHQQYIDGGIPTLTIYAIIFIVLAFITLFILAIKTRSILVASMGAMVILFAGSQCGTAGAIPMWLPTFGIIICLALMVTYRQVWY